MYKSFSDLLKGKKEGVHFQRHWKDLDTSLIIIAPHAGGIEPGTGKLARAIAGNQFSYYLFEGVQETGNKELHISSTRFDDPICLELTEKSDYAVVIHGCIGSSETIYVGGRNHHFKQMMIDELKNEGFPASLDNTKHKGTFKSNLCNTCATNKGLQFEITESFRSTLFRSLNRRGREQPTDRFYTLSTVIQNACNVYLKEVPD